MATSGQVAVSLKRADIVLQAAMLVNAIGIGESLPSDISTQFEYNLNLMLKHWQRTGIRVWKMMEGTLFPQPGQWQYRAGGNASDHITTSYVQTAMAADAMMSSTSITVESTSGMTSGDHCGVVIDDGTLFWTTIVSTSPTNIVLTDPLPDSVDTGSAVFTYTRRIERPLKVEAARAYDYASGRETPLIMTARLDYQVLPSKRDEGSMVQLFYDPQLGQGVFNLWRIPAVVTTLLKFTFQSPIEIFSTAADDPDFPDDWGLAAIYNLAMLMMPHYPVSRENRQAIPAMAQSMLLDISGADRENESVFFGVDMG